MKLRYNKEMEKSSRNLSRTFSSRFKYAVLAAGLLGVSWTSNGKAAEPAQPANVPGVNAAAQAPETKKTIKIEFDNSRPIIELEIRNDLRALKEQWKKNMAKGFFPRMRDVDGMVYLKNKYGVYKKTDVAENNRPSIFVMVIADAEAWLDLYSRPICDMPEFRNMEKPRLTVAGYTINSVIFVDSVQYVSGFPDDLLRIERRIYTYVLSIENDIKEAAEKDWVVRFGILREVYKKLKGRSLEYAVAVFNTIEPKPLSIRESIAYDVKPQEAVPNSKNQSEKPEGYVEFWIIPVETRQDVETGNIKSGTPVLYVKCDVHNMQKLSADIPANGIEKNIYITTDDSAQPAKPGEK